MADTTKKPFFARFPSGKTLRLFVSSPRDLAPERARIDAIAISLQTVAGFFGISIEVVDWISVLPQIARPQELMFNPLKRPSDWDVFVGLVWNRFEKPSDKREIFSKKLSVSGTENEFKTAYALWQEFKKPRIWLYRKVAHVSPDAIDSEQFEKVNQFFMQLNTTTGEHPVIYYEFETLAEFEAMLLEDLQKLLLEVSQLKELPSDRDGISKSVTSTGNEAESHDTGPANPEVDPYFTVSEFKLVIEIPLPRFTKENFQLIIESRTIKISGKYPNRVEGVHYLPLERMHGDFACTIEVPPGYDLAFARARYENGILTIEIPRADISAEGANYGLC